MGPCSNHHLVQNNQKSDAHLDIAIPKRTLYYPFSLLLALTCHSLFFTQLSCTWKLQSSPRINIAIHVTPLIVELEECSRNN
jgi:hypothetical protein